LARYFRECGSNKVIMAAHFFFHFPHFDARYETAELPAHFNDIAKGKVRTYGAALARARERQFCDVG